MKIIKEQLYEACQNYVLVREKTVTKTIASHQKALRSETKSSAGDKHETGRAMLQLEMEKAGQQLSGIDQMKQVLSRIEVDINTEVIKLGSLVITDQHNYFLAISAGEIQIENKKYYAVSAASPIGKMLLGKKVGDIFELSGTMMINNIY